MTKEFAVTYFICISIIAVIMTVSDKKYAIHHKYRISEKCLLTVAFFGGALAMYITMKLIRHKTKKAKFMLLLPIFIALHTIIIILLLTYTGAI